MGCACIETDYYVHLWCQLMYQSIKFCQEQGNYAWTPLAILHAQRSVSEK